MEELLKRKDIVVTNADKGSALVIMDVEKYIKNNQRYNTVIWLTTQLTDLKKENLLPKKLTDGLKSVNLNPPEFYISPKIHKEINPGRPVINSINCYTFEISRFVDHHFQPLVREIPSYIKDTIDFINKINSFPVPPDSLLVTMDVKSRYTSIPNNEGIPSVKKKYDHYPKKTIST